MVILYKLAEQIIREKKRIHVPSYYGIFRERDIEFIEVIIDDKYKRIDKQPDVIATTVSGEQFLIEFTFEYKVQHKEKIDYKQLNCIEIDLSSQTLESLQDFLLNSNEHRKWLNNQAYFDRIESTYSQHGKSVKIKNETDCIKCKIKNVCCGIRLKGQLNPIRIENSGNYYRVCKIRKYEHLIKEADEKYKQADQKKIVAEQELREPTEQEILQRKELSCKENVKYEESTKIRKDQGQLELSEITNICPRLRTCFMCKSNLDWMCRNDGYARCGAYISVGVPKKTPPETAKSCNAFRLKRKYIDMYTD